MSRLLSETETHWPLQHLSISAAVLHALTLFPKPETLWRELSRGVKKPRQWISLIMQKHRKELLSIGNI